MGRYDDALIEVFKSKYTKGAIEVRFTKKEIAEISERKGIRNVPDLLYYYAFDRGRIPEAITSLGFLSVNITGRGMYAFSKTSMTVVLPAGISFSTYRVKLPSAVKARITDDEQGILSRILYGDVLSRFFGKKVVFLQGFLRTGSELGQTEVDALYVTNDGKVCTVEAKGPKECLNRNQIVRQVEGTKAKFGVSEVIPLAIKFFRDRRIVVLEFDREYGIKRYAGYALVDA